MKKFTLFLFLLASIGSALAQSTSLGSIEAGDGCSNVFNCLARSSADSVYAFWRDGSGSSTVYKIHKWNGSSWQSYSSFNMSQVSAQATFDEGTDDVSMAIDSNGGFHVVFRGISSGSCCSQERGVVYGYSATGASWSFVKLRSSTHPSGWLNYDDPQIKIDHKGFPHVVFLLSAASGNREYTLFHYKNTGSWEGDTIFQQSGSGCMCNEITELAFNIDHDNAIHVAFTRETNGSGLDGGLWYVFDSLGTYSAAHEIIAGDTNLQEGYSPSVEIGPNNKVYILSGNYLSELKESTNASGSFVTTTINGGATGFNTREGYRIKDNGDRFMVIQDGDTLKYGILLNSASTWEFDTLITRNGAFIGFYFSGIVTNGNEVISVFDVDPAGNCSTVSRELWYAAGTYTSGSCTSPTVPVVTGGNACQNQPFSLNFTGSLNSAAKWYLYNGSCGGTAIDSTTTNSFTVTSMVDRVYYIRGEGNCVAPGSCGSDTVFIYPSVNISVDAMNDTVCENGDAMFRFSGTGHNTTITWQEFNGISWSNIPSSNNDTLILTAVTAGMDGYMYRGILNGTCYPDTTSEVLLSVILNTLITAHPMDTSACDGSDAAFSVGSIGSLLSYQWQEENGSGWSDMSGENDDSLHLSAVTTAMDGYLYRSIVSGTCGMDTSDAGKLTVIPYPIIMVNPRDTSICISETPVFRVQADGAAEYQWQYFNGISWSDINGADSSVLLFNSDSTVIIAKQDFEVSPASPVWNYSGTPSNFVSGLSSSGAAPPNSPVGIGGSRAWEVNAVSGGNQVTFQNTMISSGFDSVTVEIELAAMNLVGSSGGPDDLDYVLFEYSLDNGNSWIPRVRVRGALNNNSFWPYSAATVARVPYLPASEALFQPVNTGLNLMDGIGHVEIVFPGNINQLAMRITPRSSSSSDNWLLDDLTLTGHGNTFSSLKVDGYQFRCIASTACGTDTSDAATLTIFDETTVNSSPANDSVCDGTSVLFESSASGHNTSYQWQTHNGSSWSDLSGENNDSLTIDPAGLALSGNLYRNIVQGTCGSDTTSEAELIVWGNPVIDSISSSRNPVVYGYVPFQCADLTVHAQGGASPYSISWSPSGSGNPLQVCPTTGTWYSATVTDQNGCQDTLSKKQYVLNANSPYAGRLYMCYQYPRRPSFYTITVMPTQVNYYLGLGATLGACGSTPSKQSNALTFDGMDDIYNIFPNPFNERLTIEFFSLFNELVTVELTDMTGKSIQTLFKGQVHEGAATAIQAETSHLPQGMYLIRYSSDSDIRIHKVILTR